MNRVHDLTKLALAVCTYSLLMGTVAQLVSLAVGSMVDDPALRQPLRVSSGALVVVLGGVAGTLILLRLGIADVGQRRARRSTRVD